jgi:ABC-2 type transport system permease protein
VNSISGYRTYLLFARTAVRRLFNRYTSMKLPAIGKKTSADSAADSNRSGTAHRNDQRSLFGRLIGLWFPLSATFGLVLLTINSLFVLMDAVLLRENRTAQVFSIPAEQYSQLEAAHAIAGEEDRKEEIQKVFKSSFSSPAAWLTEASVKLATQRYEKDGLVAFASLPSGSAVGGALAYLSDEGRSVALKLAAAYLTILAITALCMGIALTSRGVSGSEPSLEFLWQFPVSRRVLFSSRLIEFTFDTPMAPAMILFNAAVLWLWGASLLGGLGVAVILGLSVTVSAAAIRLATEWMMTQHLSRKTRGMLVALVAALGSFGSLVIITGSNSQAVVESFVEFAAALPNWVFWNPLSGGLGAMPGSLLGQGQWYFAAPISAASLGALSVLYACHCTRFGLTRAQDAARTDRAAVESSSDSQSRFDAVVWKELLQIRRQPELLGQLIAAPLTITFLAYIGGYNKAIEFATSNGTNIGVALLVGGVYTLMVAASQTIVRELRMLWLLQSQPRPLAEVVRRKAHTWGAITMGLMALIVAIVSVLRPADSLSLLFRLPFLFAVLWWSSEILFGLTALSATITNETTVRFRRTLLLIPALMLADAGLAIHSGDWWLQLRVAATLAILSAAVHERQLVELNWLSEPVESPPRRLYAMHGLFALMGFGATLGIAKGLLAQTNILSPTAAVSIAYIASSLIVAVVFRTWLSENKLTTRDSTPASPVLRPLIAGIAVACSAGLVVLAGLQWLELNSQLTANGSSLPVELTGNDKWWLFGLYVVAAPLFEEWIFRGVIYRTLRRTWGVAASVAMSAILFATLHPAVACFSLIALGVMTALTVERTHRLWPSITIHAVYNFMVWCAVVFVFA